jgi:hypothetical protein
MCGRQEEVSFHVSNSISIIANILSLYLHFCSALLLLSRRIPGIPVETVSEVSNEILDEIESHCNGINNVSKCFEHIHFFVSVSLHLSQGYCTNQISPASLALQIWLHYIDHGLNVKVSAVKLGTLCSTKS